MAKDLDIESCWEPDEDGGYQATNTGAVDVSVSPNGTGSASWCVQWYGGEGVHGVSDTVEQAKSAAITCAREVLRESNAGLDSLENG